jgi:hypothetical protein
MFWFALPVIAISRAYSSIKVSKDPLFPAEILPALPDLHPLIFTHSTLPGLFHLQ